MVTHCLVSFSMDWPRSLHPTRNSKFADYCDDDAPTVTVSALSAAMLTKMVLLNLNGSYCWHVDFVHSTSMKTMISQHRAQIKRFSHQCHY